MRRGSLRTAGVLLGGLLIPGPAPAQSAPAPEIVGCWTLSWGPLPEWGGSDSIYYRPPPFVRFVDGGHPAIDVPEGSIPSPHRLTNWSVVGDTLRALWSTGMVGVSVRLTPEGDDLTGTLQPFTDVIGLPPKPTTDIRAVRRPCDAPLEHPAEAMRRLPRRIALEGGSEIVLGEPLPDDVRPTDGERGWRVVAGPTAGLFPGAPSIRVRLDGRGRVSRIRLEIPPEQADAVADRVAEAWGRWDYRGEESWRWQGRTQSLWVARHPRGGWRVTLEDPRLPLW